MRHLTSLEILDLSGFVIASIPNSISCLTNLKRLTLQPARALNLVTLPDSIGKLTNLEELFVSGALELVSLPDSIGALICLKKLEILQARKLDALPDSIGALTSLEILTLRGAGITSLPTSICCLSNLKELCLDGTKNLTNLPDQIGKLSNLNHLELGNSGIVSLPGDSKGNIANLNDRHLESTTEIHSLPLRHLELYKRLKDLKNLRILGLSGSIFHYSFAYQEILLRLALQLPLLRYVGTLGDSSIEHDIIQILSFNRAGSRIVVSKTTEHEEVSFPSSSLCKICFCRISSSQMSELHMASVQRVCFR